MATRDIMRSNATVVFFILILKNTGTLSESRRFFYMHSIFMILPISFALNSEFPGQHLLGYTVMVFFTYQSYI